MPTAVHQPLSCPVTSFLSQESWRAVKGFLSQRPSAAPWNSGPLHTPHPARCTPHTPHSQQVNPGPGPATQQRAPWHPERGLTWPTFAPAARCYLSSKPRSSSEGSERPGWDTASPGRPPGVCGGVTRAVTRRAPAPQGGGGATLRPASPRPPHAQLRPEPSCSRLLPGQHHYSWTHSNNARGRRRQDSGAMFKELHWG